MFSQSLPLLNLDDALARLENYTPDTVKATLARTSWTPADFPIFISPAADSFLEEMAQRAQSITLQRFGRNIQLFIPLYISNLCYNKCTYCGFSVEKKYPRKILSDAEILREGSLLASKGFQHLLILTGEAEDKVGVDFIAHAVTLLRPLFSSISIEVQPLSQPEYARLHELGVDGLTLFQETYHPNAYSRYHLAGKKKHFSNRLDAVEAGAAAGFNRIALGALLGLYKWRYEALALAQHIAYLQKKYWKTQYSISFPRIKDMGTEFTIEDPVSDRNIIQYITAFRLCFPDLGITLSTRESPEFRDNVFPIAITQMSAESNTAPGGYSGEHEAPQFEVSDHRSLTEIQSMIRSKGYSPVLKDWFI